VWSLLLNRLLNKNSIIIILVATSAFAINDTVHRRIELKKIQAVYQNPDVKTIEKIVYKEGPVRIKVVTVKEENREITTRTEEHGGSETTTEAGTETKVVPVASAMTPARTDRYLLTVGLNRLTPDFDGKALFVGYGFKNRLDLQVGGIEHDGFSPWVLATIRF
jgi:hypothetical protein